MGIELEHVLSLQASAGALVGLFLMSLYQMSGHPTNGKHRKRAVKQETKRKQ